LSRGLGDVYKRQMWQMEASPSVALQRTWQAFLEHHPAQWANVVLLGAP
jgi:hypothetical protein